MPDTTVVLTPRGDDDHQEHDRGGHRQQRGAAFEGAEAEHLLQVEVQEEPHRDPCRPEQELREVGRRQVRRAEDAQTHQRLADTRLDGDEERQQRHAAAEDEQGLGGAPALLRRADDREHGHGQAHRRGDRAGEIDRAAARGHGRHERRRDSENDQRDRDVDVEDPGPRHPLGDHAAQEDAGGAPGGCGGAVDGEGLHQLLRVVAEEHHQQRQCRRGDECRADALDRTGGDLDAGRLGEAGGERAGGQDRPAGEEQALGAEQVGQAAAQEEQAAEGDDVGVEDPREVAGAEAEIALDLGQGHADDRRVHDHHELRERDDGKGRPAPRVGGLHEVPFCVGLRAM
jgi:hypothetical protein